MLQLEGEEACEVMLELQGGTWSNNRMGKGQISTDQSNELRSKAEPVEDLSYSSGRRIVARVTCNYLYIEFVQNEDL